MVQFALNTCSIGASPRGNLSFPDQVTAAAQAGFSLLGLDVNTIREFISEGNSIEDMRAFLDDNGMGCLEVHILRCGLAGIENTNHEREAHEIALWAQVLGAPWVNNSVYIGIHDGAIEHVQKCSAILKQYGVGLSVEFQPENALATVEQALELTRAIGDDAVRIQPDTWHLFRGDSRLSTLAGAAAREIAFVQFGDGSPSNSATDDRALPGYGEFDLEAFVEVIEKTGFDGVVEIETFVSELMRGDAARSARIQLERTTPYWE